MNLHKVTFMLLCVLGLIGYRKTGVLRGLGWLVSLVFLPAGNEVFELRIFSLRTVELIFADALLRQRFDSEQGFGQAPSLGGGVADGALEVFPA